MKVWQRADILSKEIHKRTLSFPKFENFEVGSQMRRSSASIPDNISEGSGKSVNVFINALKIARGSAKELEVQIGRCFEFGYFSVEDKDKYLKELDEIGKMISGVIRWIERKTKKKK